MCKDLIEEIENLNIYAKEKLWISWRKNPKFSRSFL
jgi:hypothetical protein